MTKAWITKQILQQEEHNKSYFRRGLEQGSDFVSLERTLWTVYIYNKFLQNIK